jgi:hypothetical protein
MNELKRKKNEAEYDKWIEKADGIRIYSFEIKGRQGWKALYLKEVNSEEITLRFWQEVYDEINILREIHEKYPTDKGHKKL